MKRHRMQDILFCRKRRPMGSLHHKLVVMCHQELKKHRKDKDNVRELNFLRGGLELWGDTRHPKRVRGCRALYRYAIRINQRWIKTIACPTVYGYQEGEEI